MNSLEESVESGTYKKTKLGPKTLKLPSDWKAQTLGSVTGINMGSSPKSKYYNEEGDGLPFFQGNADFGAKNPETTVWCTNPNKTADEGDLLISVRAPVGDLNIANQHCCIGRGLAGVSGEEVNTDFLYFLLTFERPRLGTYAQGSTFKSVNSDVLNNFPIQYPPLPEQRRISEILSTVDEQIQQTDEMVEAAKDLKYGLMQDLLIKGIGHDDYKEGYLGPRRLKIPSEWKKARLAEVSEIITRGKQPTYVEKGGVPVLNQSCIYWDGFHPEELKRLDAEVADGWKGKYWVKEGDVLINSTGKGTLGRALEWTKESDTYALDSHITRVHPDESVLDPTYFRFYLESNHGQKMLYAFCVAGSTGQIELSKTDLQTMPILLPPIEEQREISEAFHRVNEKLQNEQETKDELKELKRGLIQDLLTGKVRVDAD